MELLLFVLIAGAAGYFIAGSRLSKPIDVTAEKVADTTRAAAGNVENWFSRTFRQERKPKDELLEAEVKPASREETAVEAAPAAKQTSRRKSESAPSEDMAEG